MNTTKSDLDPWRIICGHLFEIDSYYIPELVDKTGMEVDWSLTDRQNYSHKYRKAAYRPRIDFAYQSLSTDDQLRVSYTIVAELAKMGNIDALDNDLKRIGWSIAEDKLVPIGTDVKEIFFSKDSQHDAYVQIRQIIQEATTSIIVIDPYIDSSIFTVFKTASPQSLNFRVLTFRPPSDFVHEAQKFLSQFNKCKIEIRKTKEFHDRFIVLDAINCWHIGCSIKDAGNKAFMISKIEDNANRDALVAQVKSTWANAKVVNI